LHIPKQQQDTTMKHSVIVILLIIVGFTHSLKPSSFNNVNYHCSSVYGSEGRVYSMVYYINHFLSKGQLIIRSFDNIDNVTNTNIVIGFGVLNVSFTATTSSNFNTSNGYFNLEFTTRNTSDKYYQKQMTYYTLDITNVSNNSVYFEYFTINGDMVVPNTELCQDKTEKQVIDYYFQNSFSITSVVVSGLHVVFGVVLFIMQIVLARYPLMKSRLLSEIPSGIAVNISDLSVLVLYSVDLYFIHQKGVRSTPLLVISGYIRSWLIYVACCAYVLNCIRYLLMLNFYRLMRQGSTAISSLQKFLLSKIMFVSILSLFAVGMLVICIVTLATVGVNALDIQSILVTILTIASCVIAVLSGLLCIVLEIIVSYNSIRKRGILCYFTRDVLYIRLQMLVIILLIVIGIPYGILFAFLTPNYTSISLTYGRVFAYCIVYLLFGFILRLLMSGAFITPIQLVQLISNNDTQREITSDVQFENLMKDPEFYDIMYAYCNREFSLENLLFWNHLMELKKNNSQVDFGTVTKIANKFIKPFSAVQINLPNPVVKRFLALLTTMEQQQQTHVSFNEMYYIVRTELMMNLNDTLSRLYATTEYKQWEHKNALSTQLVEKQY
jgi:hypothetical protein